MIAISGTIVNINSGGAAALGKRRIGGITVVADGSGYSRHGQSRGITTSRPQTPAHSPTDSASNVSPITSSSSQSAASDAPTHNPNDPDNQEKKPWIEIQLNDEDGNPVPGEPYKVTLPDGTTIADGTLDDKGFARVDNIDPGTCQVTFPNLDKEAWGPA